MGGWLEKWGLKLTSAKVEAEVDVELGNTCYAHTHSTPLQAKPNLWPGLVQRVLFLIGINGTCCCWLPLEFFDQIVKLWSKD